LSLPYCLCLAKKPNKPTKRHFNVGFYSIFDSTDRDQVAFSQASQQTYELYRQTQKNEKGGEHRVVVQFAKNSGLLRLLCFLCGFA